MADAPSPHGLNSTHHEGTLADTQAPQFLKTDGSRNLTGNLAVSDTVTVDGVDISVFYNNYQTHLGDALSHNYIRNLLDDSGVAAPKGVTTNDVKLYGGTGITVTKTTEGLQIAATGGGGGGGSSFSGIKDPASTGVAPDGLGWILTTDDNVVNVAASGANTLAFTVNQGNISHGNLGGVTANQHHNQSHVLATNTALGPDHTISGATAGYVLRASSATAAAFAQLAHSELSSAGTNSHAQIDTHIAATVAHGATGAVVGTTNSQTLTNKTLTSPVIGTIVNTGTLTLPTSTDTLIGRATTDTLTNKTYSGGTNSGTQAGDHTLSGQVTFSNATAPIIAAKLGPVSTQQHTLPAVASDTVALLAATQTLTNKTLTTPTIGSFVNATHNHQAAAGGGTLDHGAALTGLGDDDHTQYLLATGARTGASSSSQTFTVGVIDSSLTASRLMASDGSKKLASVANLASWIAGTANQVTVTDDLDGSVTLSLPQNIHTAATPTFARLTLSQTTGTAPLTVSSTTKVANLNADLLDDLNTSSNPGAAAAVLTSDGTGMLTLPIFTATTRVRTSTIDSATGTALTLSPAQNLILNPGTSITSMAANAAIQASSYASQTTGWRITDPGEADFRYLFVDEMHAKSFIADLEQALAGGQIISKSVAMLGADFTLPTAGNTGTLWVRDLPSAPNMAVFQAGDFVGLRQFSRSAGALTISWAWGTVATYVDGTGGNEGLQSWQFTRHAGTPGSATGTIYKDAIVLDFGTTGNGFYEVNAIDGTYGANSPYAQVVTWASHPATQTVRARFGHLKGIFNVANEFGLYGGTGTAVTDRYVRASSTAVELRNVPLALYDGTNNTVLLSAGGSNNSPFFAMGTTLPTSSVAGNGIWMGLESSVYRFRVGTVSASVLTAGILWDGSVLTWKAANTSLDSSGNLTATSATLSGSITAGSGAIGGWSIGATTLAATNITLTSGAANTAHILAGTGSTAGGVNSANASGDIVFWAGSTHASRATAVYRVTAAGAITATNGLIGGWTLGETTLTGGNAILSNTGKLTLGTSNDVAIVNAADATYRLWVGHATAASAPFRVTKAGALTASNADITGAITANSGSIAGVLSIGSSGGIYQGTGTFASPTTGLKIWNDSGVGSIAGYNAGVAQWYAGTDGKFYAGGGVVALDSTGAKITMSATTWASQNALRMIDGAGIETGGLYGYTVSGNHVIGVRGIGSATVRPNLYLQATGNGTGAASGGEVLLSSFDTASGKTANILLETTSTTSEITIGTADVVYVTPPLAAYQVVRPASDLLADLGTASIRWNTLYVNQIIATTIGGTTLSGAEWEYAGSMVIDANSASNTTVSVTNQGVGTASLDVEGNITLGGTVDGVDVAAHNSSTAQHGATGAVVGTTNTQTLTNKTLTAPVIATIVNTGTLTLPTATDTLVGRATTDTLTNKTLTTPTISGTGFTNAQHAHAGASSGGTIAHSSTTGRTANDHHNQSHVLATNTALGPDHTISGATAGHVLRASSATAAAFAAIQDADLPATIVRTSRTLTAGAGLTGGGNLSADRTFDVGAGTLITVAADTVGLSVGSAQYQMITTGASPFTPAYTAMSTLAGGGLTHSAGVLAVGQGAGLTVNADDVALTTPGTLTASTTNSSTGNHTHGITTGAATTLSVSTANGAGLSASLARADHLHTITSSSNPGAAASLLATDASGKLNLAVLGVGGLPAGSDKFNVVGHATLDSADFSGAVEIADDLAVSYGGYYPLYVNVNTVTPSASNVGIMTNTPDPQFALDVAGPARAEMFVGPHALQLADAEMIVHFDGPRPYATDYSGFSTGHMGQAGTESGGVIYRPGKFGKAVQIAEATTNLISNPSFENDVTTGWSFDGKTGGTRTQSSDAYYGSYSCKITSHTGPAGSYLAMWPSVSLVAYTTYVFSLWCKNVNLSLSPFFSIIDVGGGSVTLASGSFSPTNEWSRVQIQFTTGASVSDVRCYIRIGVNGGSFLIDGVQLEAKAYVTPYCDGSLGTGHSWSGTAHASTSSRTAARLGYSTSALRSSAGTIGMWAKCGSSSTTYARILAHYNSGNRIYIIRRNSDGVWFAGVGDTTLLITGIAVDSGWHHFALSWNGSAATFYIDGVSMGTSAYTNLSAFDTYIYLTGYPLGDADNHLIDDFVVLSRVASADEIRAIYESNAPVFAESSVFSFRAPTRSPVWVDEEGLWARAYSGNEALGIYAGEATKSWGGKTLYDSHLLIGNSTAGYVHWRSGVSASDPVYGNPMLELSGEMHVKNNSTFDGTISIGSSGGIYQGTGTFASPTTGLKIWNDSGVGRIGGYNSGTAQWYASTDGKLYAGGGSVTLDANGIVISANDAGLMVWKSAGDSIGQFVSGRSSTINSLHLNAVNTTSFGSVRISAHAKDNGDSWIALVEDAVSNNFKGVFIGKVGGEPTAMLDVYGDGKFSDTLTLPNTGLHLLDTDASHDLIIAPGSNLTADRTLTVTTGDSNRTLTMTGNATVNQDVSTAGSPTFAQVNVDNLRLDGNVLSSTSGAVTVTPLAGQNFNVSLSTTGDFAVNTNHLYVDTSTGYVGIQTTAPATTLNVVGTTNITGLTSIGANNISGQGIVLDGSGVDGIIYNNRTAGNLILKSTQTNTGVRFWTNNGTTISERMRVDSSGNVLIGTITDSGYKLDISGTLRATGAAYLTDIRPVSDSTTALQLKRSGGTAVVTVDTTNNRMGINTSSPGVALHVIGAATVTADMVVGNNVIYADTAFNRLGINTSSPGYPLQVEGQSRFNGNVGINDTPDASYSLKVNGDAYMNRVGLGTAPNASYRIDAAGNIKIGGDIWATGNLDLDGNLTHTYKNRLTNQYLTASTGHTTSWVVSNNESYIVMVQISSGSGSGLIESAVWYVSRVDTSVESVLMAGGILYHSISCNSGTSYQIRTYNNSGAARYHTLSATRIL